MSFLMSWRRLCRTMWPFCVVCLAALLVVVLSRLAEQTGSNPIKASPVKRGTQLYWSCFIIQWLMICAWFCTFVIICTGVSFISLTVTHLILLYWPTLHNQRCVHTTWIFLLTACTRVHHMSDLWIPTSCNCFQIAVQCMTITLIWPAWSINMHTLLLLCC